MLGTETEQMVSRNGVWEVINRCTGVVYTIWFYLDVGAVPVIIDLTWTHEDALQHGRFMVLLDAHAATYRN